jgi:hypothetical protein
MESKTPEELAALYAYHHTRFGDNPDWLAATWMNGHCEGYARGYAAALPKWVSVEERLPEPGTWVLIYLKHKREYWADEIVEKNRKVSIKKHDIWYERRLVFFENEDEWEDEGVTDWLSFPTPPTKEP